MNSPPGWWQTRGLIACLLYPVSLSFGLVVAWRHRRGAGRKGQPADVHVIVVGNISVGGTGKSPLVAHLARLLLTRGHRVGIVSRGYGGRAQRMPVVVGPDSDPALVGDEPVMHARLSGVPVCVCIDRPLAVARLREDPGVDVVISDDGLQHYAMARSLEIVVVDGERGFGNRWLLPAGPLREPVSRLRSVDLVAVQVAGCAPPSGRDGVRHADPQAVQHEPGPGRRHASLDVSGCSCVAGEFTLGIDSAVNLATGDAVSLDCLPQGPVHAVTGLGNPRRFFDSLIDRGFSVIEHAFGDHHQFTAHELRFDDDRPVLVTSKDAVKIAQLPIELHRFTEVRVVLQADAVLANAIDDMLARLPVCHPRIRNTGL